MYGFLLSWCDLNEYLPTGPRLKEKSMASNSHFIVFQYILHRSATPHINHRGKIRIKPAITVISREQDGM